MAKKSSKKSVAPLTEGNVSKGGQNPSNASSKRPPAPGGSKEGVGVSKFQRFKIAKIHRSKIKLADYNPRTMDKHAQKKLRESLKGHGLVEPLIFNSRTGTLVGGHQRIQQLDALEGNQDYYLDVSVVDVPLEEEQSLNIALNNPILQGTYDLDAIEQLLGQPNFPVSGTGFDRASLGTLLDEGVLDGIFGTEAAEQAAAEQPVISELLEIKESGREVDATEKDREAKRQAEIQRMREGRKQFIERSRDADASEFMVILVADKESEVDKFLMGLELPVDQRYIDMRVVADRLGINLGSGSPSPAAAESSTTPVGK